jgi:hypothetical protein
MAEKTKKPVKLRKRAPQIVKDDRRARNKQANQLINATRKYLRGLHGTGEEIVEDWRERAHVPLTKEIPEHPVEHGMKRLYLDGLSDINFWINGECGDLDKSRVGSRWTIRALHTGDLLGVAPTGQEVTFSGFSVCLGEGEFVKLVEPFTNRLNVYITHRWVYWVTDEWNYWDLPGLVAQLRGEAAPS